MKISLKHKSTTKNTAAKTQLREEPSMSVNKKHKPLLKQKKKKNNS